MESGRTVQTTEDVVFYIYLDGLTLAVVSNYTAGNMGNKKFIKKKTFEGFKNEKADLDLVHSRK